MHSQAEVHKRKTYDLPILRKLKPEQAALFLVGHAYVGHQGAEDLLELLFPEPSDRKSPFG